MSGRIEPIDPPQTLHALYVSSSIATNMGPFMFCDNVCRDSYIDKWKDQWVDYRKDTYQVKVGPNTCDWCGAEL